MLKLNDVWSLNHVSLFVRYIIKLIHLGSKYSGLTHYFTLSFYCTLKDMQTFKFKSKLHNNNIVTFLLLSIIITVKNNKPWNTGTHKVYQIHPSPSLREQMPFLALDPLAYFFVGETRAQKGVCSRRLPTILSFLTCWSKLLSSERSAKMIDTAV